MNKPLFQRYLYEFEQDGIPMIEIWTVSRHPEQTADNPQIYVDVVIRTRSEHERLVVFGEDALTGNVVLPVPPARELRQQFLSADQQSAIDLLVQRHTHDPRVKHEAEALVYSL